MDQDSGSVNPGTALEADDVAEPSGLDEDALFQVLRDWVSADIAHLAEWRSEAKKDFDFVAGRQWEHEDIKKLQDEQRPIVTFNKTNKFIRAVCGVEANNRQTSLFMPKDLTNPGEVKANEVLTSASEWMEAGCQAVRHQSRAFRDMTICGIGCTEGLIDTDEDPDGKYEECRVNPLEIGWDRNARDSNIQDSRRRWRVRRMTLTEARALLPGVTDAPDITVADLNASWASDVSDPKNGDPKTQEQKELREENTGIHDPNAEVNIVQIQWWEHEAYVRTLHPQTMQKVDLSEDEFEQVSRVAMTRGIQLPSAKLRRKVYKQAFIGGKVLKVGPAPRGDGFTLNVMTGEPDDNEGIWYGLVRPLRDPQVWSNKFFSQTMHIINSTAKGGIIAEEDAFVDIREAQANYAKPQGIVVARNGAISKGKIMAKPGAGIAAGVMNLMQVADEAFSSVSGMNLELMGLADRDQPGVLEAQRKQAAMTILATLFDSASAFKAEVARMRLFFIQNYLADGRLIRVHGDDGHMAMPLLKDKTMGRYDVIVADAPSSPNMKEKAWAGLSMILPAFKDMLTPKVAGVLIDYVPHIPSKLAEALKAMTNEAPPPEMIAEKKRASDAEIAKTEGAAMASKASAMLSLAKAGAEQAKANEVKVQSFLNMLGFGKAPPAAPVEDAFSPASGDVPQLQGVPELPILPEAQTGGLQPAGNVVLPGGLTNGAQR